MRISDERTAVDEFFAKATEAMSPEETEARLRELEEWGVDLSIVRTALARTPTERLQLLEDRLALIEEMRRAWQRQYPATRPYVDQAPPHLDRTSRQ